MLQTAVPGPACAPSRCWRTSPPCTRHPLDVADARRAARPRVVRPDAVPAALRRASSSGWLLRWRSSAARSWSSWTSRPPGWTRRRRRVTWDLLDELRGDGVTIVLTTHYMDEAEQLADHVHVIDRGRLIASGSPLELTRGSGTSTIRLVVTEPFPPGAPASLQATLGDGTDVQVHRRAQPADHRTRGRQHTGEGLGLVRGAGRAAGVAVAGPAHARGRLPADHRPGARR